jgi:hypothetical protein
MTADTKQTLLVTMVAIILWILLDYPTSQNDLKRLWFRVRGGKQREQEQGTKENLNGKPTSPAKQQQASNETLVG